MVKKYRKETVLRKLDEGPVHEVLKLASTGNLEVFNRSELNEIIGELDFKAFHNEDPSATLFLLTALYKYKIPSLIQVLKDEIHDSLESLRLTYSFDSKLDYKLLIFLVECSKMEISDVELILTEALSMGLHISQDLGEKNEYINFLNEMAVQGIESVKEFIERMKISRLDYSTLFDKNDCLNIGYKSEFDERIMVSVADYENENIRKNLIDPEEILIPDEKITIVFNYPASFLIDFKNKGGFSRLNLFRCIYEGYKKLWRNRAKYLSELILEGMYYYKKDNLVFLSIGI